MARRRYRLLIGQKEHPETGELLSPGQQWDCEESLIPQEWLTGQVLPHVPGSASRGMPPMSMPLCVLVSEPH